MSREMKESALPWVGNIPSNWRLGRIKHIYSVTLGKMISPLQTESEQTLENYLCAANIKWSGVDTSVHKQMWFNKSEKEQYLLEDGDVLIMEGGTVGTTTIYHNEFSPCYIQNSVHKCRGKDMIANKFLYYWMQVVQSSGYIDTVCNKATIQHYTKDKVKETPCILVPEDEQHAIVRYLDSKCASIDKAIERHRKIIEKLEEYRTEVVTSEILGLHHNDVIETGIDWMSRMSASRKAWRLKYLVKEPLKYGANESGTTYDETLPRYIRITDITPEGRLKDTGKLSLTEEQASKYLLEDGTILFARSGATVGKTFLYREAYGRSAFAGYLISAVPDTEMMVPGWLKYYTESLPYKNWKDMIFTQATIQNIGADKYSELIVPVCGIGRIIYNAVTGKIDCREAVK